MNKLPLFTKGRTGKISFRTGGRSDVHLWLYGLSTIVTFFFILLFIRLFQLVIVKGNYYRRLADQNRLRQLVIEPLRGKIIDRRGLTISENRPADLKQNELRLKSLRLYQSAEAIAPVVGYTQIADKNNLIGDSCLIKLKLGDRIGKKGVEKLYDCSLRGRSGKKIIEVDAKGRYLKTLMVVPAVKGETIQLALDLDLQQKSYDLMKGKKGAVVAVKPKTGEVIVLVSTPSFNPEKVEQAIYDENKPLFNRATSGAYPPGSIFKLVVTAAALEEKAIKPDTLVEDTGTIKAGPIAFGNWYYLQYGRTEGMVDIVKAIRRSNDTFFYKTGEALGEDKIKLWAQKFGYGRESRSGLDENGGLIPSAFWKKETYGEQWYLGDTYNLSIGQGYILVTPLQVTMATAAIANDGYLCQPQLLKIQNCKKLPISTGTLSLIKEGMKQACSPGGTGWPLFNFKVQSTKIKVEEKNKTASESANLKEIQTNCKTGTAESHAESKIPHAWFTVYAPSDNPEIVLTVLVEEGGQGSDVAGPIAKEILKSYFERKE